MKEKWTFREFMWLAVRDPWAQWMALAYVSVIGSAFMGSFAGNWVGHAAALVVMSVGAFAGWRARQISVWYEEQEQGNGDPG